LFYLEIDQHAKQLTISQRDLSGDVAQRRQVSAEPVGLLGGFRTQTIRGIRSKVR